MDNNSNQLNLQHSKTFINYKFVSISFTYSFIVNLTEGNEKDISSNFLDFSKRIVKKNDENGWQYGSPENREGVTPLTTIFQNVGGDKNPKYSEKLIYRNVTNKYFPEKKCELTFYDKLGEEESLQCNIEVMSRIFFNGSGCTTFTISYSHKNIDWRLIKMILALSNRSSENKQFSKLNGDLIYNYFLKYSDNLISETGHDLYCKSLVNVDIAKTIGKFNNNFGISPQNPNIQLVIDLNEQEPFWQYSDVENELNNDIQLLFELQNKEIANLLLNIVPEEFNSGKNRLQIENVRIPNKLRTKNGFLKNLSWDSRLFVAIYRQISIIVQLNHNKPNIPFIRRSLLDAVELLHTRWYFNIIMNALLDNEIDRLSDTSVIVNTDILEDLIGKRKLFAYFLHNSIPYRFWGGSVTDVISIAEKNMWLEKLKEMTYKKFQIIDQIIDQSMQYTSLKSFKKARENKIIESKIEDKKPWYKM